MFNKKCGHGTVLIGWRQRRARLGARAKPKPARAPQPTGRSVRSGVIPASARLDVAEVGKAVLMTDRMSVAAPALAAYCGVTLQSPVALLRIAIRTTVARSKNEDQRCQVC
jgi:hypothetical protein